MDKTKVDDMLIEMISPKVKEIEEKFAKGEGLTQEDINTLLLKSQYNHINHLDQKLDETVESVKALENKFLGLEGKFKNLEDKFEQFKVEIRLENEKNFSEFKAENEKRFNRFEEKLNNLELKIEQNQTEIQKILISTMKWYIGGAGIILIVLKALDIFIK